MYKQQIFSITLFPIKAIDKPPNIKNTKEISQYLCGDNLKYKNIFGEKKFIQFDESIKKTLNQGGQE